MSAEPEGKRSDLIAEKYCKVRELLDKKTKDDPEDEPYKSKYEAREILCEMKIELSKRIDDSDDETNVRERAMLGGVFFMLGSVSMEVDEYSTGEEYLNNAFDLLVENDAHPDNILCLISTLNQLGLLWSQRGKDTKAFEYLQKSEQLYNSFKSRSDNPPTDFMEIFTGKARDAEKASDMIFEKTHTLTMYYLAQVYKSLDQPLKAAQYCHWTLRRQLETKDLDKVDWALNSATLSQFLLEKNAFKAARHHLAAASYMLDQRQSELDVIVSEEEQHEADKEQLLHRKSDVARCWSKYGLNLLFSSKSRLIDSDQDLPREVFHIPEELEELWFLSLELEEYESKVSCDFLLTFEDARPVFMFAQDCLKKAKEYYTLEQHASDFIAIQQDLSQLYLGLAFFEDDEGRQCKMHKRRIDILNSLLNEISHVHYLLQSRELLLELAETYGAIIDIKSSVVQDSRTQQVINKHNYMCYQAIQSYKSFLNTFHPHRSISPESCTQPYPREFERQALLSHVYSARLMTKMINADRKQVLLNYKEAFNLYKFVVDYCNQHKEANASMDTEFRLCVEMVNLLPYKMSKISEQCS